MSRSTLILVGTAAVLVALVLLLVNPFRDRIHVDAGGKPLFAQGVVEGSTRIVIRPPALPETVLEKREGVWVVASQADFPADTSAVGTILRAVGQARSSGVVSTNPGNRGKFMVDSTGARVEFWTGGKSAARLVVGKPGQDFTTSYVRREGENDVQTVRGLNRNLFTRPLGFRDRTLLRFEASAVAGVSRSGAAGSWELARVDTTWTVARPGESPLPAPGPTVNQVLRVLSNLAADGFVDAGLDTLSTGLTPPDMVFTVRLLNGTSMELRVGVKNNRNQYYAARPDRGAVYLLGEWRVTGFAKSFEELHGPAPAGP